MPYKDPERQRQYQRERIAARRQAWLREHGPCECGSWDRLEVDHVDPATKVDHKVWSWSESRRNVELAKCRPRCAECHKRKTARERREHVLPIEHSWKGWYRGCRCAICRESWVTRKRDHRARCRAEGRDVVL